MSRWRPDAAGVLRPLDEGHAPRSEIIKTMARLLWTMDNGSWLPDPWPEREIYEERCRALVFAMREPTEAMIEAAYCPAGEAGDDSCSRDTARDAWQAMVDEALK